MPQRSWRLAVTHDTGWTRYGKAVHASIADNVAEALIRHSLIRNLLFAARRFALRTPLRILQLGDMLGTDGVD